MLLRSGFTAFILLGAACLAPNAADPLEASLALPVAAADCRLLIEAPVHEASYSWASARFLAASIDVKFGSGPVSDAVRAAPHAYEVCVEWAPDRWPFRPDSCRPLIANDGRAGEVRELPS